MPVSCRLRLRAEKGKTDMNLSMKWLSDYVNIDVPVRKFCADMTMSGSKVESYAAEGEGVSGCVVGKVLSVEKHPNADSLFICQIDTGGGRPLQICTAAANVVAGAHVPVFTDGAVTATGQKIKKGKLRGEASEGMLCSLPELGLSRGDFPYASEDGIFLLGDDCEPAQLGQNALDAIGLNDTKVEFEITPNRPDCLSVRGLAREAAVTYGLPLKERAPIVKGSGGDVNEHLRVRVENETNCLRYIGAVVKNVRIAPSPRWMRERLRASGVRPISNIVDITNYVMLEYGQPMHAFDLAHVAGGQIVVRDAAPGEKITTLDGVERTLTSDMLVIADEAKPSAIAGVMGGEYSGIYDTTQSVVFESACFFGPSVRSTSKKLGLRTESSGRFEKGLDPEGCLLGVRRALELVEMLDAGDVVNGLIDCKSPVPPPVAIPLDDGWIRSFLGADIPREFIENTLRALGFTVENGLVTPPSWRGDVTSKYDLAEEAARFRGYGNIPATLLRGAAQGLFTPEQKFLRSLHAALLSQGMHEIVTYSFFSPKAYDLIRLPEDSPQRRSVRIRNPLGEDTGVMRTTALPSMLEALARNYSRTRGGDCVRLYEIATEYLPGSADKLPLEKQSVILGMYGAGTDFFSVKGVAEALLERARVTGWEAVPVAGHPAFHPGRCCALMLGDVRLGVVGQAHPAVCENYRVDTPLFLASLDVEALRAHACPEPQFRPLPRFPVSTRDLALVCDETVTNGQILQAITQAGGKLLDSCVLFDIYRSPQLGEGKKSLAYALTLRADDRTLTDGECDKAVGKILKALAGLEVTLRGN